MTETKRFKTVADMRALPLDKIEHFCTDLMLWLKLMAMAEAIAGLSVTTEREAFDWIDDDRHDITVTINAVDKV